VAHPISINAMAAGPSSFAAFLFLAPPALVLPILLWIMESSAGLLPSTLRRSMDAKSTQSALAFAHYLGLPKSIGRSAAAIPNKVVEKARAAKQSVVAKVRRKPIDETPFADVMRVTEPEQSADHINAVVTQAVQADRQRAHEIMAAGLSRGCASFASYLALKTDLSVTEAISILRARDEDEADRKADLAKKSPASSNWTAEKARREHNQ
jgi:hypothetical protein